MSKKKKKVEDVLMGETCVNHVDKASAFFFKFKKKKAILTTLLLSNLFRGGEKKKYNMIEKCVVCVWSLIVRENKPLLKRCSCLFHLCLVSFIDIKVHKHFF